MDLQIVDEDDDFFASIDLDRCGVALSRLSLIDFSHSRAQLMFHFEIHSVWLRMPKSQAKEAKVQPLLGHKVSRLHRTPKGPAKSLSLLK